MDYKIILIIMTIIVITVIIISLFIKFNKLNNQSEIDASIFKNKVSFCFIVRDGEEYLDKNIKRLLN